MRTFDLDTLQIFKVLAREGGVLRAARTLNRVPSNVSTRIKQMEDRLGVDLLRRQGRNVVLTDAGTTLLVYAERLLKLAEEGEAATRNAVGSGRLRIGSMESTAASRLPKLLSAFHRRNPSVDVTLETGTTRALIGKLRDYHLDAVFIGEPFVDDGLSVHPAFDETLVLVTSKKHRPVKSPSELEVSSILAFGRGCSYRTRLEDWLTRRGVVVERILELSSYQAIVACAAAGTGCGIMPRSVVESLKATREVQCHQLPRDVARNTTHLAWIGEPAAQLVRLLQLLGTKTLTTA